MNLSKSIANILTNFTKNNSSNKYSNEKLLEINYGLITFVNNLFKPIFFLIISYFLNIFTYGLITIITFSVLRMFTGGFHAKTPVSCFLMTFITFYIVSISSFYINANKIIYIIFSFIAALIIISMFAPVPTKKRPIRSSDLKNTLKTRSFIVLIGLFIISLMASNKISITICNSCNLVCILILIQAFTNHCEEVRLNGK